jgi:hypothetical protein
VAYKEFSPNLHTHVLPVAFPFGSVSSDLLRISTLRFQTCSCCVLVTLNQIDSCYCPHQSLAHIYHKAKRLQSYTRLHQSTIIRSTKT